MRRIGALIAIAALMAFAGIASAATPIQGFEEQTLATGLGQAIGIDVAPDGRVFIADKRGRLRVILPDGTVKLVLDITSKVNSRADRGLTGVAVDKDFANNQYVYLLYTFESNTLNPTGPKTSKLTRIRVNPDSTPGSGETTILGKYQTNSFNEACPAPPNGADCLPADGLSHVAGTVRADDDGTLWVGNGDAAYNAQNAPDPFRTFNEQSLAGKILHIDREGRGLPGHPLCPTVTSLGAACTKIFASGFRNPFRFSPAPSGGLPNVWAGDVGMARREELDLVQPGRSYGWPCYEATERYTPQSTKFACTTRYSREGTSAAETMPAFSYPHGPDGAAIIGGPQVPEGGPYGSQFARSVFFGDYVLGRLDRAIVRPDGSVERVEPFATDWHGTDLILGPDGYLYSANFNSVSRFVPANGNRAPIAAATADQTAGLEPLTVQFDGTGSSDPDGDELTYSWDFGDGATAQGPTASHVYTGNAWYTARLTVTDPGGLSSTAEIRVRVGNRAPDLTIERPLDLSLFEAGATLELWAAMSDLEDGMPPDSSLTWSVVMHHNTHTHGASSLFGRRTTFTTLTDHDSDSFYVIEARAVDSEGLETVKRVRVNPRTVPLQIRTDPAPDTPVDVSYDSRPQTMPFTHDAAVGFRTTVVVPDTIRSGGKTLVFKEFSDGPTSRSRPLEIPGTGLDLVARYVEDTRAPDTFFEDFRTVSGTRVTPIKFWSDEPGSTFECRLGSGEWFSCTSPWQARMQNGVRTVRVRAIDRAGNVDTTPATGQITVIAF